MTTIPIHVGKPSKFKFKTNSGRNVQNITLVMDEPQSPNASDTLAHAIGLYSTLRDLWRKAGPSENGIVYVKVRGEFVEVRVTRPKF